MHVYMLYVCMQCVHMHVCVCMLCVYVCVCVHACMCVFCLHVCDQLIMPASTPKCLTRMT